MRMKMNKLVFLLLVIALLAAAASMRSHRAQQDSAKPATSTPAAPKPSPEMERLMFYVGEWDYTERYEKTPQLPGGGKNTGLYTSTRGPGGNSLLQHFHSQGPMGDFEGMMVITWDPKEKAYKEYAFGNDFPGCIVETGQFEGEALVFRGEFAMGPTKVAVRNTTRLVSPGKIVSQEYSSANGAPEALFLTVEAVKK